MADIKLVVTNDTNWDMRIVGANGEVEREITYDIPNYSDREQGEQLRTNRRKGNLAN